MRWSWST